MKIKNLWSVKMHMCIDRNQVMMRPIKKIRVFPAVQGYTFKLEQLLIGFLVLLKK